VRLPYVPELAKREYAVIFYARPSVMSRHRAFENLGQLEDFLAYSAPLHVYRSSALYQYPDAEMGLKGLIGADLVFDIDADHLKTPCNKEHDVWTCQNCGAVGRGQTPEKCPKCAGEKLKTRTWFCEQCLETAKQHTMRLLDILQADFGFDRKEINVFFSGHRGYHIHVLNADVRLLGSDERREIVDYASAAALNLDYYGFKHISGKPVYPSIRNAEGWERRIIKGMRGFLSQATVESITGVGIKRNIAELLVNNRARVTASWALGGPWMAVKGVSDDTWRKLAKYVVDQQVAQVDTVVTIDLHRLIRLPGTIHGKTGFKVAPVSQLETFNPLNDAIVFKEGKIQVKVFEMPRVKIMNEVFEPLKNVETSLPAYLAVLLVLKGSAEETEK